MIDGRPYTIPQLATITLNASDPYSPTLEIILEPDHQSDLNDLALTTYGPDNVFLRVDSMTVHANELLHRFMEIMEHHDHTGDDIPDCDEFIEAIENAFRDTEERPKSFYWPYKGIYASLVERLMPQQPVRHIVMGFGKLTERIRPRHYPVVILMVAAFIGLVVLQDNLCPILKYSPITGFLAVTEHFGLPTLAGMALFVLCGFLLRLVGKRFDDREDAMESAMSPHTAGFFSKAAVLEEQAFREGSENWTWFERARSCVAFGLIHQINLFYPLSTVLPLTLGGAVLMFVYLRKYRQRRNRRAAVLRAAVWHRVYNRVAIGVAVSTILFSFGSWVVHIVGGLLALALLGMVLNGNAGQLRPRNIKALVYSTK